ncbi:MAG: class I SAM-dependent methyltransferase [Myxococcota bacterium]
MPNDDLYDARFVTALFDEMAATYGVTNYVSSFGFCERWRRQAVAAARIERGAHVVDLMSGSGECWRFLQQRLGANGRVIAVDLSSEMCRRARENTRRFNASTIEVRQLDALDSGLSEACADHVVACFGLKTFSSSQLTCLAREVRRIMKPTGSFSFVEISVPANVWLRAPYLFYLRHVIPLVGRVFLGNPENYRMLAVYTEAFADGAEVERLFRAAGLQVRCDSLFFGCARRFVGGSAVHGTVANEADSFAQRWLWTIAAAFVIGALLSSALALVPLGIDFWRAYWGADALTIILRPGWWVALIRLGLLGGACCALGMTLFLWWGRPRE